MKPIFRFRLWGKKRGARSTGSPRAGSLGEAIFFGVLFLLGTIALTALVTSQILHPTPELYQFGFGFWLVVLVLASFVLIGGIGVLHAAAQVGTSAEWRSALVRRAAGMELIRDALPSAHDYPNVPRDTRLTDSPGIILKYRLPTGRRVAWQLATTAGLSLLLSGFAAVLAVLFLQTALAGHPSWFVLAFALPFLVAGSWSVYGLLRSVLHFSRVGPTFVEISDLPLRPGKEYDIFVSQSGRFRLQSLEMSLVCEEEATYHQGTDIRTEVRVVFRCNVFARQDAQLEPGAPLEVHEILPIPAGAMHSFQSAHNAVRWKLVVRGTPAQWPPFERSFPILIYPVSHAHPQQPAYEVDGVRHGTAD